MEKTRIEDYLAQIAEDGYCIIENVLSPEKADAIAHEVRKLEAELDIQEHQALQKLSCTSKTETS